MRSRHILSMLTTCPRRQALERSSIKGVSPGCWQNIRQLACGGETVLRGAALEPESLAAPAVLIGNDVPTARSCAARTAHAAGAACAACRCAGATHPSLLCQPGGGRSSADRKGAKIRQHSLDMPGSVFWDGEVRWLMEWKRDDALLKPPRTRSASTLG